ncbi:MAG: hypothetical protein V2J89_15870 [Halieaceae bacterium]|jgi:hypothetical protein|nr:hypothetical protein [Halieaceae bacterium]
MSNDEDSYSLFMNALDVTNEAIDKHRDTPVIKQLFSGAEKVLAGRSLGVAVYKTKPDAPYDYFTVRYNNGKFELEERGKGDTDIAWRVSQEYLQDINDNPARYVDNPLLLDTDWIKTRLAA